MKTSFYKIGAGIGEDDHGHLIPAHVAQETLVKLDGLAAKLFGGFGRVELAGGWIDDTGRLIAEPGISYEIFTDKDPQMVRAFAQEVRQCLRQKCVLFAQIPVTTAVFI